MRANFSVRARSNTPFSRSARTDHAVSIAKRKNERVKTKSEEYTKLLERYANCDELTFFSSPVQFPFH